MSYSRVYALEPRYDRAQSFYGKAHVLIDVDCRFTQWLQSYDTIVAAYHEDTGLFYLGSAWDQSATTLRHVKEFIKQNVGLDLGKLTLPRIERLLKTDGVVDGMMYRVSRAELRELR